ncbi:MAG: hypothetical protein U1E67_00115 [Hyphomicrobiales bacterium]
MSIRLSAENREWLARLALERELEIVDNIKRGLSDMKADRVVAHAAAMARLRATVENRSR